MNKAGKRGNIIVIMSGNGDKNDGYRSASDEIKPVTFDNGSKSVDDMSKIIRPVIIAIAILLVINFLVGLNNHRVARDNCQTQLNQLNKTLTKYSKHSSDVKKALTMKDDDVADPNTINSLNRAVDDQQDTLSDQHTCDTSGSTQKLNNQTASIQSYGSLVERKSQAVEDAADAVLKSHAANNVDDAKQAVEDKIAEAKDLMSRASSKVKRTKTYQALRSGVNEVAEKIKNSHFDSAKAYTELKNTLQGLIDSFKN